LTRSSTSGRPAEPQRRRAACASPRISTILVDDHELVRKGVRSLLESEADIAVVGEAADGREAVAMAARLRPDVVVLDIAMPRLNGLEAARRILDVWPKARMLVLSAHCDEEFVDGFMALGAAGYVLKHTSLEVLATAIRTVRAGKPYFCPSISRYILDATSPRIGPRRAPSARLTSREAEVLQFVAEGRANKQTAVQLGISIKTVEKHRQSLMAKLHIHDVAGLTRYAIAVGAIAGRDRIGAC